MFEAPFSFSGRIRRTEYGLSLIINSVLSFFISLIVRGTNGDAVFCWFILAQGAKRSHDIGYSGLCQLVPFYPLFLLFAAGEVGTNCYGKDPKNRNLQDSYSSPNKV